MLSEIIENTNDFLSQRICVLQDGDVKGKYVLYWMKHAVRAHENPALDVALNIAQKLSLPLLVYHEISEDEPYASDRRFAFEIEGARDVQEELLRRSLDYTFWVQRRSEESRLEQVGGDAAIIVAEDMPVPSERAAKQKLASKLSTPILLVDTACIVPMQLVGKAYTRAFTYRGATSKERTVRKKSLYSECEYQPAPIPKASLDKFTVLLQSADLRSILTTLDIDHNIAPVSDTTGGSAAGYKRWSFFSKEKLSRYATDRNNPLLDPSSRMSAYLRLGHVSPFRIAREAALIGGGGVYKYLDEFLIWRELAYTFCKFTPELDSLGAVPDWAVKSLREHESDQRSHLYSYDELYFGKTHEPLWNAAQLSLLNRGELHNNVRMTWGKAFLHWTKTADDALAKLISLNHRLALDGNDPSSYGGLLWCLGQFDRPFPPDKPITGLVRDRSIAAHTRRLNVDQYLALQGREGAQNDVHK